MVERGEFELSPPWNANMWRKVLSSLLLVATLAGQSFCCCTLHAFNTSLKHDSSDDSCCCQRTEGSSSGCPDSPRGRGHECPCKKGKVVAANLPSEPAVVSVYFDQWVAPLAFEAQLGRLMAVDVKQSNATYLCSRAFPRLDGAGILRAVKSLRC